MRFEAYPARRAISVPSAEAIIMNGNNTNNPVRTYSRVPKLRTFA